ncbi:carboxypeptidase-like regulatory domain-containing protein [Flavobacterium sp. ST-87]|uniref:Carboxypeptidase-like regulatory domain-containing protein n=1 Tax=Flavobacterium plantiphilum TaxID=3163297 RepID=A0ABW8XU56_9FLAO
MKCNRWLFYFLFIISFSYAQQQTSKTPLTDIIQTIEQQFNVKFSYVVEDVASIHIEKPAATLSLQETMEYLNSKIPLNFKLLDQRYITISVLNKSFSVCGVVLDEESKTTLPGASVRISNNSKWTVCSKNGSFNLEDVAADATISISYIGYETKNFKAKEFFSINKKCKEIYLKSSKEELNPVLISLFLTSGLQKTTDGSTVLNTKKFGILPGLTEPDILQSIQTLPGIESSNESIANINVRGGTNDQNLMLWDNIKMYHSGHFFGLISAYNPNLTQKVVVTKNGTSAEYSDGVSSMIKMSTNNEIKNKISGGAGINLISADAYIEIPLTKNLEIDLSARHSITDMVNTPAYSNYYKKSFQDSEINADNAAKNSDSDFSFYDYTAKILFDLNENHQFRANFIGINNALNYAENQNQNTTKTSSLSQKNTGYGGNWKAQWNSRLSSFVSSYFSRYNIDARDYRVSEDQLLSEANEVIETGTKLNVYYDFNPNLKLLNGYQINETGMLNQTRVSAPFYSSTKKKVLLNHAFFSEIEYNKKNSYVRLGMRINYFQKFDKLLFEPRINFRQKLTKELALKVEGELKNQTTTQIIDFEDDFLGVEKRRWQLVDNNEIPIARSKQFSTGIDFNTNNWNIELTGFYKIVDGITASNQGFYNNFQFKKANGSYTNKGIEFLINKTTTRYSTWISYTFNNNNYNFESFTPSTFPNNLDIRHSVTFGFNYTVYNNLKVSVGGIWRNGIPYTKPVEGNETVQNGNNTFVNYDAPNSLNLDDFFRLDTSISYHFNFTPTVKTTLRAGIINVTNQNNTINRYYKVDPDTSGKAIEINNYSLALTPNVSFRVNF